jgi:hypothetical protein
MFNPQQTSTGDRAVVPTIPAGWPRWRAVAAVSVSAWALTACGGGAYVDSSGNFNIGVTIAGQFVSDTPVSSGGTLDLVVRAGQSVVLNAGEAAVWTVYVGGVAATGGVQVYYAGATITATTLNSSSVAVDTYAANRLAAPIAVTLVATATYDSAQVATVNMLITN